MPNKVIPYKPALKVIAGKLRKNSTLAEVLLWQQIKNKVLGYQFHRQVPIDNYIVDFYCHEIVLCIEVDGNSHEIETIAAHDIERQERLESLGVRFIRINDRDVKKDIQNVIRAIAGMIEEITK